MANNTLVVGELAINNGVVARKPSYMEEDYWQRYEVPRIGKCYTKHGELYGIEWDINKDLYKQHQIVVSNTRQDIDDCVGCKI